jgi:hypothetical protein
VPGAVTFAGCLTQACIDATATSALPASCGSARRVMQYLMNRSNRDRYSPTSTWAAGATLYALRQQVGDPMFRAIERAWVTTFRGRSASTEDFIALASRVSGQDLTAFLRDWLFGTTTAGDLTAPVATTGRASERMDCRSSGSAPMSVSGARVRGLAIAPRVHTIVTCHPSGARTTIVDGLGAGDSDGTRRRTGKGREEEADQEGDQGDPDPGRRQVEEATHLPCTRTRRTGCLHPHRIPG